MRERTYISILIRATQFFLWACLSILILIPSSDLYAQDPEDDVEEYWGDDDEYEEYEDEDEYLDDDEYDDYEEYEDDEEY